jgi:hypothetical protein
MNDRFGGFWNGRQCYVGLKRTVTRLFVSIDECGLVCYAHHEGMIRGSRDRDRTSTVQYRY